MLKLTELVYLLLSFFLSRESQGDFRALEVEILETEISRLENFSINSESTKFGDLIEDIFGEYEAPTAREHEMPDDQFRCFIRRLLSKMKMKDCVKGYSYNKDSKVLRFVMIFFISVTTITYSVLNFTLFNLILS